MRNIGFLILAVGVIWLLVALNIDTSVATGYGGRVNNIGLMANKQNQIIIGGIVIVCGLIISVFCKSTPSYKIVKCPFCAEGINRDAVKCKHCGSDVSEHTSKGQLTKIHGHDANELIITNPDGKRELNLSVVSEIAMKMHIEMPNNKALSVMVTNAPTINMFKEAMDKKMGRDFESHLESELIRIKSKK
ncbi:hypothetical protein [Serratia marcescens]|uniref:hypothetical protein n=1 Tax=Serratia marcescens TaxID=615 RepID=UPI0007452DF8|nr:hypothetical protein [Serratia marcescens]MBH3132605.1 hypothetical protein [Serratia marcescens]MDP8730663.1 hypothetical protein [Serratia marcescens]CVD75123.1 Uncharacterised protein [Serratia marcescens]